MKYEINIHRHKENPTLNKEEQDILSLLSVSFFFLYFLEIFKNVVIKLLEWKREISPTNNKSKKFEGMNS